MSYTYSERPTSQLLLLSALTPGHISLADLRAQSHLLNTTVIPGATTPTYCYSALALFDTDQYRSEILHNVENILEKYQGDFLAANTQNLRAEKDLLWATLQLYGHLQAIEQEIGLVLEPKTEYEKSVKNLEFCLNLLKKNGSNTAEIESLLQHKPILTEIESGQWYEKSFKSFIKYIDDRNNTRLFWVWGRPNLDLALDYANQSTARERLSETTYLPGQISWSLYLFRGSLFALKMFYVWWNNPKWLQTLKEAGLSEEEYLEYRLRYLMAYWDVYKYRILNDYVWGPINLFCLKWWVGSGFYGWLGDFATCFLLWMDLYLSDLTFAEEEQKQNENQQQYTERYQELSKYILQSITHNIALQQELSKCNGGFDELEDTEKIKTLYDYLAQKMQKSVPLNKGELKLYEWISDLNEVEAARAAHTQRWQKKVAFLKYDCIYTRSLLFAFAMWTAFLVGGLLPAAIAIFFVQFGTFLCLALTIIYRTARAFLEIDQNKEERKTLQAREEDYLKEYLLLKTAAPNAENSKKMRDLYLHILNVGTQINHQSAMIHYQYLELARTSLLRILVPILIGVTLVFAPATVWMIPSYVFTLAISAALAYALDVWAKSYKPDPVKQLSKVEEPAYGRFFSAPKAFSQHVEENYFCFPSFAN